MSYVVYYNAENNDVIIRKCKNSNCWNRYAWSRRFGKVIGRRGYTGRYITDEEAKILHKHKKNNTLTAGIVEEIIRRSYGF